MISNNYNEKTKKKRPQKDMTRTSLLQYTPLATL